MNNETSGAMAEQTALNAVGSQAMEVNLKAVAELAGLVDQRQQAEHIRGVVATTMAYLSAEATTATLAHAAQWRDWALGLTDGIGAVLLPAAT